MFEGMFCAPWECSPLLFWNHLKDNHQQDPKGFALQCSKHFQTDLPQQVKQSIKLDERSEYNVP